MPDSCAPCGAAAYRTALAADVTADSPHAVNTWARPDTVTVHNAKREVEGEHLDVTFAPHSFTLLEIPLA